MEIFILVLFGIGTILSFWGCIKGNIQPVCFGLMFMGLACVASPLLPASQKLADMEKMPAVILGAILIATGVGILIRTMSRFPLMFMMLISLFTLFSVNNGGAQSTNIEILVSPKGSFTGFNFRSVQISGDKDGRIAEMLEERLVALGATKTPGTGTRLVGKAYWRQPAGKKFETGTSFGVEVVVGSKGSFQSGKGFKTRQEVQGGGTYLELSRKIAVVLCDNLAPKVPAHVAEVTRQRKLLGLKD